MGSTLAVIILILIGIILLLLEFLVIPGTSIAAIGGIIFMGAGVYMAYETFGSVAGNWVLAGSLVFFLISFIWAIRSGTWKKFGLKANIDGVISQTEIADEVKKDDQGVSVSRLNPMGRVKINSKYYEAQSYEGYVDENTPVKVVKVDFNKIIVKKITK
jgi:membrane-bound ClpP family serine protease